MHSPRREYYWSMANMIGARAQLFATWNRGGNQKWGVQKPGLRADHVPHFSLKLDKSTTTCRGEIISAFVLMSAIPHVVQTFGYCQRRVSRTKLLLAFSVSICVVRQDDFDTAELPSMFCYPTW